MARAGEVWTGLHRSWTGLDSSGQVWPVLDRTGQVWQVPNSNFSTNFGAFGLEPTMLQNDDRILHHFDWVISESVFEKHKTRNCFMKSDFVGSPTFVASDPNAATYGLFSVMTSVLEARTSGKGIHVEFSQLEAMAHASADQDEALKELATSLGLDTSFMESSSSVLPCVNGDFICVYWPTDFKGFDKKKISQQVCDLEFDDAKGLLRKAKLQFVKVIEKPTEVGAGSVNKSTLIPTIHPVTGPEEIVAAPWWIDNCLLYTSPSPRDATLYRMPSSA